MEELKKFDLQLFAITEDELENIPTNPSTQSATVGKGYLLFVNIGKVLTPDWLLVGGQRGLGLSRTAEEIDVSHKTSGGYTSTLAGLRDWEIDLSGLVLLYDVGYRCLELAYEQGKEVNIKIQYPTNPNNKNEKPKIQVGWGALTDFSLDAPHDGPATLSGKISGNGPLSSRGYEEPYTEHLKQIMTEGDYANLTKGAV